jgi:hypothetical protein
MKLSEVRKALVALVAVVAQVVAWGVLSGTALTWAQLVIAVAAAAGVYTVPNAKPA